MVSGLAQADAEFLAALRADRLIAIVRGTDRSATVAATLTLLEEGVANVEISLSGTDALAALAQAIKVSGPEAYIGAGTVLTGEQAHAAHGVGARFVVTPALGDGVSASRELGLPVLAGALTPSEIVTARAAATAVKLFPPPTSASATSRRSSRRCPTRRSCRSAGSMNDSPSSTSRPAPSRSASALRCCATLPTATAT